MLGRDLPCHCHIHTPERPKRLSTACDSTTCHSRLEFDRSRATRALVTDLAIFDIDAVIARHYRFTDEELDFVVNYDIKYRVGAEDADAEE